VALLVVALALFGLLSAIAVGLVAGDVEGLRLDAEPSRSRYLADAQARLGRWYQQNAATLDDGVSVLPATDAIFAQAGVAQRFNVQMGVTQSVVVNGVGSRQIVVWLPDASGNATFDVMTGALTPTPQHSVRIRGHDVQQRLVVITQERLGKAASTITSWAASAERSQPALAGTNLMRRSVCAASAMALPCWDAYVPVDWVPILGFAGPEEIRKDAWGRDIEVSNLLDSSSVTPPYSLSLRAVTPWGAPLRLSALQPL
jgi:type II secretory pathway pseudopilin PulG